MLRKILLGLLVLVVVLLAVVMTRPGTYHVERSALVAAPAEVAFASVNDFRAWDAWSPWAKLDPQMKTTIDGPESGVGARYHWSGNDKVGEGEMRITESAAPGRIAIKLDFLKPFASTSTTTFTFTPAEGGTHVTWAMDGKADFMTKAMSLMAPMDKMIGPDFEKGLAQLKTVAEAAAADADTAAAGPSTP